MANVIIKDEKRKERENKVLRDFGYTENSNTEIREKAQYIAEKCYEVLKNNK